MSNIQESPTKKQRLGDDQTMAIDGNVTPPPTVIATITTPPPSSRTYLACPFSEKDQCKQLGGKWDFRKKKWYVESNCTSNIGLFSRWFVRNNDNKKANDNNNNHSNGKKRKGKKSIVRPIILPEKVLPPPTDEQSIILGHDIKLNDFLAIIAAAGTGKTTTLQMLSKEIIKKFPSYTILYCAFNKVAQEDASRRFGPKVLCKTLHALAFRWFRELHADVKVEVQEDDFNNFNDIATILKFDSYHIVEDDKEKVANFAWQTMINFTYSSEEEPNDTQVFQGALTWHLKEQTRPFPYAQWAKIIFDICRNPKDNRLPLMHDIYLKECQLAHVQLTSKRSSKPFDVVMLDEAQDVTQCQVELIRNQYSSARFLIGDPHQSIYQFRGADCALERLIPTLSKKFKLQKSL